MWRLRYLLLTGAVLTTGSLGGCRWLQQRGAAKSAREDLAVAPRETDIVFTLNLRRARASAQWAKLLALRDQEPRAKQRYDELVQRCQIDPLKQVDSLFLAVPRDSDQTREFLLVVRGDFSAEAAVGCARNLAQDQYHKPLQEQDYSGHKLYSVPGAEGSLAVLGAGALALGGPGWTKKALDLQDGRAPGQSAKDRPDLLALVGRARTAQVLWMAGLVPPKVQQSLRQNPQLGVAGTMQSLNAALDLAEGVELHAAMELGSAPAATEMAQRVQEQLQTARKSSTVQLLGMAHYFDAIKVSQKDSVFQADVALSAEQVADLQGRLAGLAKQARIGASPVQGMGAP